jgi:HSP20 family protein
MTDNRPVVRGSSEIAPQPTNGKLAQAKPTVPAVDVLENEHGITLFADLPGVDKSGLHIQIHDGHLSIEAKAVVPAPQGLSVHFAEISEPSFARSFALSADLDTSQIQAELNDGVLRLTIPRREAARPRRIEVAG